MQHRFQASSGGQFRIVAAPILDTKVIVAAAFNQVNTVYRRHTTSCGVQRPDPRPSDWNEVPSRMPGIYCEHQEISTEPSTGNGILGPVCGLSSYGDQAPPNQNQTNLS